MLKSFSYQLNAGPLPTEEALLEDWQIGNCRRAIQLYFLISKRVFLPPEKVLCPAAYHQTGNFIFRKGESVDFGLCKAGDIIYAERIRNKDGGLIDKSEKSFIREDDYITSLHTAIYTGDPGREIYHATSIEGGSCNWSLKRFLEFYKPVAVKRIATSDHRRNFRGT